MAVVEIITVEKITASNGNNDSNRSSRLAHVERQLSKRENLTQEERQLLERVRSALEKEEAASQEKDKCSLYGKTLVPIEGAVETEGYFREGLTIHIDGNKIYYNRQDISQKSSKNLTTGFVEIGNNPTMDKIVSEIIVAAQDTQKICYAEKPGLKINTQVLTSDCLMRNGIKIKHGYSMTVYSNKSDPCKSQCIPMNVGCNNGTLIYSKNISDPLEFDQLTCYCPKK